MGRKPRGQLLRKQPCGLSVTSMNARPHTGRRSQYCSVLIHVALPSRKIQAAHPCVFLREMLGRVRSHFI